MEKSIADIDVLYCQKVIQWTRTKDTLVIQSLKNKVCDEITVFKNRLQMMAYDLLI
jgi:hypothetical protein